VSILTAILVFIVIWWLVWFIALPIGVKAPENVEIGNTESAPDKPQLWLKAGITTLVSILLAGIIIYLLQSGAFSIIE
tara:strand:- start:777 stop:1010 length:234 start_codon:yes stop_codon:yes gene_type:complete